MNKTIKILSILFVILLFIANISFATDINMDLEPEDVVSNNNTLNQNLENDNLNEEIADDDFTEEDSDYIADENQTTSISSLSSVPDETLSLTNILNILLIVVGVVLILLGIAILIRMHS